MFFFQLDVQIKADRSFFDFKDRNLEYAMVGVILSAGYKVCLIFTTYVYWWVFVLFMLTLRELLCDWSKLHKSTNLHGLTLLGKVTVLNLTYRGSFLFFLWNHWFNYLILFKFTLLRNNYNFYGSFQYTIILFVDGCKEKESMDKPSWHCP